MQWSRRRCRRANVSGAGGGVADMAAHAATRRPDLCLPDMARLLPPKRGAAASGVDATSRRRRRLRRRLRNSRRRRCPRLSRGPWPRN